MILADDNFATIVKAVVNGRGVYTNIKNAINFLLSGNMAGIICVFLTSILALPVPCLLYTSYRSLMRAKSASLYSYLGW